MPGVEDAIHMIVSNAEADGMHALPRWFDDALKTHLSESQDDAKTLFKALFMHIKNAPEDSWARKMLRTQEAAGFLRQIAADHGFPMK